MKRCTSHIGMPPPLEVANDDLVAEYDGRAKADGYRRVGEATVKRAGSVAAKPKDLPLYEVCAEVEPIES